MKVRARIRVEGLVHGVFFRYNTQREAHRLRVKGWVRNLPDGSVECVAEGDEERVKELIQWSHHGPPGARVERVKVQWEEYRGDLKGFEIRY